MKKKLVAIIPFYNFAGSQVFVDNHRQQIESLSKQNVDHITVECAYQNNFSFSKDESYQLNTNSILWQKEAIINTVATQLHDKYDYIAWIDSGLLLEDGWKERAMEKLQQHDAVQLFSYGIYKGKDGKEEKRPRCMMRCVEENFFEYNKEKNEHPSPGGGWAVKSEFFQHSFLYPYEIVGGGDTLFIYIASKHKKHKGIFPLLSNSDRKVAEAWCKKSFPLINSASYISGYFIHLYHGSHKNRRQQYRTNILKQNDYNPAVDVKYVNGVLEWSSKNEKLQKKVEEYLLGRFEDVK